MASIIATQLENDVAAAGELVLWGLLLAPLASAALFRSFWIALLTSAPVSIAVTWIWAFEVASLDPNFADFDSFLSFILALFGAGVLVYDFIVVGIVRLLTIGISRLHGVQPTP